jgi:hypothetical protein
VGPIAGRRRVVSPACPTPPRSEPDPVIPAAGAALRRARRVIKPPAGGMLGTRRDKGRMTKPPGAGRLEKQNKRHRLDVRWKGKSFPTSGSCEGDADLGGVGASLEAWLPSSPPPPPNSAVTRGSALRGTSKPSAASSVSMSISRRHIASDQATSEGRSRAIKAGGRGRGT